MIIDLRNRIEAAGDPHSVSSEPAEQEAVQHEESVFGIFFSGKTVFHTSDRI
jgi:hypothetical protein